MAKNMVRTYLHFRILKFPLKMGVDPGKNGLTKHQGLTHRRWDWKQQLSVFDQYKKSPEFNIILKFSGKVMQTNIAMEVMAHRIL